jgi:hypothetical protein
MHLLSTFNGNAPKMLHPFQHSSGTIKHTEMFIYYQEFTEYRSEKDGKHGYVRTV